MPVARPSPTNDELRPPASPDLRRDSESVLQVSRVAAELFWRDGVAATRGEDIAAVAGISVRTLWRYFRSKEACVEPILTSLARPLVDLVAAWPLDRTLQEYLADRPSSGRVTYTPDQERGMRMVVLGHAEPALRVSWLMICDRFERSLLPVFAKRLHLPDDHPDVARITAAVVGANRAFNDSLAIEYTTTGIPPRAELVAETLQRCITEPSGHRLGRATTPHHTGEDAP